MYIITQYKNNKYKDETGVLSCDIICVNNSIYTLVRTALYLLLVVFFFQKRSWLKTFEVNEFGKQFTLFFNVLI